MVEMHESPATEVDPALLELPRPRPSHDGSVAHIEEALRSSGLDAEIEHALPVRGGDAADYWGQWDHETTALGPYGRSPIFADLEQIRWPASLFIPRGADYRDYWITPPPDSQRYAFAWPARNNGVRPDWADAQSGELFAHTMVPSTDPGADTRSEAGIGIRYSPTFTLGTVDFQPIVNVTNGMLTSALEYYPTVSAGHVTLSASVVLAAWHIIPGGFDLLDYAVLPIARITRDQSHGAERSKLPGSLYVPRPFRKRFLVQKGRDYLFGVVGRVEASSTLTGSNGRPLQGLNGDNFAVYSFVTLGIPYMTVDTATVFQK